MGDEDHRQPQLLLQLAQQTQHVGLDFRIQHADALIADQHLRVQGQRPCDRYPLLLAPGQLARQAVLKTFRWSQAHPFQ